VKKKAAGHTIEAKPPPEDRGNVIDLMEALRESMGQRTAKRRSSKRVAKRKRTKRKAA